MSSLLSLLQASCDVCAVPVAQVQPPSICDTKVEGVAPVAVGWIDCDVVLTAPLTLAQIQALVAANQASFAPVVNFVANEEEVESFTIDPFTPDVPSAYTKMFNFDAPYFDRTGKTCKLFWDDKLDPANFKRRFPILVFQGDRIEWYRTKQGYTLTSKGSYDTTARTNKTERKFEMSVKWTDPQNKSLDWTLIAGISAAYGA